MLVLTRKVGERIVVGNAEVTVLRVRGSAVKLGVEAPEDVPILRREIVLEDPPRREVA